MKRRFGLLAVAAAVLAAGPDLGACGDKSLSAGGIRRQRALAARYPASVLAYVPANSPVAAAARELKLRETLPWVGHRYREVATLAELRASIETGQFNIILTDLGTAGDVERDLGSSSTRVVLVPVAYQLTKAQAREAQRQRRFLIKAPSKAVDYLTTIAEAVALRSAGARKG
jgi:hypothetical protein